MVTDIGDINFKSKVPHIYFIVKENFLYVGETQKSPIIRWSSHLNDGTFIENLRRIDSELAEDKNISTYLFGFSCEELLEFQNLHSVKKLTQYVEHLVQLTIISNKKFSSFRIISNTRSTCPSVYNFSEGKKIAEEIVKKFELKLFQS